MMAQIHGDLRARLPRIVSEVGDARFSRLTREGLEAAVQFGLITEAWIEVYTWLFVWIGPSFADFPPFNVHLNGPGLTPEERLQRLLDATTEKQWLQASRRYGENDRRRFFEEHDRARSADSRRASN